MNLDRNLARQTDDAWCLRKASRRGMVLASVLLASLAVDPESAPAAAAAAKPAAAAAAKPAAAKPTVNPDTLTEAGTIALEVNQAKRVPLSFAATTVFVANPDIADVQAPNPQNIIVFGKKSGSTKVIAFARNGRAISYGLRVTAPVADINNAMHDAAPGAHVDVTSTPKGIIVNGQAPTPADANAARNAAAQFVGDKDQVVLHMNAGNGTQVNLRVRVAEVTRDAEKQFGFNWNAAYNTGKFAVGLLTGRDPAGAALGSFIRDTSTGQADSLGLAYRNGSVDIATLIDALQSEGLISVLAEPNLTTTSGEPASFLAGGEFPVPIAQSLQAITIEWKRFGVAIDFTPTVLSPNRISMRVAPEVSELSAQGAVVVNNVAVPGLTVRRADTTVELASGQTFAVAGLFQNNVSNEVKNMPWLSDVPVLGALFRSTKFQRHESELVILVTPYIVTPTSSPDGLHLPTEGITYASDLEQLLLGHLTSKSTPAPVTPGAPHLGGAAGFVME